MFVEILGWIKFKLGHLKSITYYPVSLPKKLIAHAFWVSLVQILVTPELLRGWVVLSRLVNL